MSDKDYSQLTSATSVNDTDLVAVYPTGGPLKKMTWATLKAAIISSLTGTYLTVANNLSDLASASSARANLGLGSVATLAASAVFQVANNLSEVASAATARTNIGAAAAASPTITGGATLSGSVKGNPQALGALEIDASVGEWFTKSISTNSTFTTTGWTASKAQGFMLKLTTSSGAVPTWPAAVKWTGGAAPILGDGVHLLGFVSDDGGTTIYGAVFGSQMA